MRIPPYHRDPGWQRFLSGAVVGAIIGWLIFLFIYGTQQEIMVGNLDKYQKELKTLKDRIHILTEDNDKLKEEKDTLKIQDFDISIINHDKYRLNSLSRFSIIDHITNDLNHLISKDIKNVKDNKELLVKSIENESYKLDDKTYFFHVYSLYIDTTIEIDLMITKIE